MMEFLDDMDVSLVQSMGNDASVIAAAKVSTKGVESLAELDQQATPGLIRYLMTNRHGTPFEHASMTFYMHMPIFVFREFHRHRIGWSYNEESARYKQLEPVFYLPSANRPGMMQIEGGKPGQYQYEDADPALALHIREAIHDHSIEAYQYYQVLMDRGVAKEVARMVLPVNIYSSQYATCNPRSLMAFLSLRTKRPEWSYHEEDLRDNVECGRAKTPSKPQWEINRVADKMEAIFAKFMPLTYQAFCDAGRVAP